MGEISRLKETATQKSDENSLLDRISKLESERYKKEGSYKKIEKEKETLIKRLQEMENLKKEYENVNQKVEETSFMRQESLNREVNFLKQELANLKKEKTELDEDNKRLVENMAKSEIEFTRREKEKVDENEQLNNRQKSLEDMIDEYKLKVKQVEGELLERRNELNKLKSKGNSYHKNYNMMNQLYKTNEAKVRSLESEVRKLKADLNKREVKMGRAKEAMETLAGELRRKGLKRRGFTELLGSVCELIDLDEVFDEELSIDTEEEMKWNVNQNLREAHKDLDEKSIMGMEEEFEKEINGFNTLDSDVFNNMEYNEGNQVPNYKWYGESKEPEQIDIFKRNEDSQLTETRSHTETRKTDQTKEEYRSQLEEEIEGNVMKRMRPSRSFHKQKRASKESGAKTGQSDDTVTGTHRKSSVGISVNTDITEMQKSRLYGKCRQLDSEIFEVVEKEQIEMRLKMFKKFDDFIVWLLDYTEEKIRKVKSEYKALLSEKSNFLF